MTAHPYNLVRIDQGLAEEAKRLAADGIFMGRQVAAIIDHHDAHVYAGHTIQRLQEIFDEILEGICEALYSNRPDRYNVVYWSAYVNFRPSFNPRGEVSAQPKLDDALETYASISQEDAEAELADQR